jgi:hypothetical protein
MFARIIYGSALFATRHPMLADLVPASPGWAYPSKLKERPDGGAGFGAGAMAGLQSSQRRAVSDETKPKAIRKHS